MVIGARAWVFGALQGCLLNVLLSNLGKGLMKKRLRRVRSALIGIADRRALQGFIWFHKGFLILGS